MSSKTSYLRTITLVLLTCIITACAGSSRAATSTPPTWQQQKDMMLAKARELGPDASVTIVTARTLPHLSPLPIPPFSMSFQIDTPGGWQASFSYDDDDLPRSLRILSQGDRAGYWPGQLSANADLPAAFERVKLGPRDIFPIIRTKGEDFAAKYDSLFTPQIVLQLSDMAGKARHQPPVWVVMIPTTGEHLLLFIDAESGAILEEKLFPKPTSATR